MPARARIIVSGKVQKGGYRVFVHEKAFELDLNGYVRNLEDGTVEVVCEGEKEVLMELAQRIDIKEFPVKVEGMKIECSDATGEFDDFTVVRDERFDGDLAGKLDLGLVYIRRMHVDLAGKQEKTLEKQDATQGAIKNMHADLSAKQEDTTSAIRTMDGHTCERFDRLEGKYDRFGDTLDEVSRDLKRLAAGAAGNDSDREESRE